VSTSDRVISVGLSYLLLINLIRIGCYDFTMKNQLAYLSGYIDGDGCFYIGKNIRPIKYRSGIIISSTNKEILRFFKKMEIGTLKNSKNPIAILFLLEKILLNKLIN
jgi:LAGLIDADG-like domain